MMKSFQPHLFRSLIPLCALAVSSCGFWKNDPAPVAPVAKVIPVVPVSHVAPKPIVPPKQPVTKTLVFHVDSALTTGTTNLVMDPKGAILGSRTSRDSSALKGKITVKVTEDPSTGHRRMSIHDVHLTNTEAYNMDFAWGALVGRITVDIPAGVLRIIPNSMKAHCALMPDQPFSLPQCHFTVLGHSRTCGHGLVLSKAVGDKKMDLTMKKTEQVSLRGTLKEANGIATLHIPRAVLRDKFDIDGTSLDLVFTADITATAKME